MEEAKSLALKIQQEKKQQQNNYDGYILNGIYRSDLELLFSIVTKEELMVMIKRGFIGLGEPPCYLVKTPYISMWEYVADETRTLKWEQIQCPLHISQTGKCELYTEQNTNHYKPCEVLAHYLTSKLIFTRKR
jgi:hypothetical protein